MALLEIKRAEAERDLRKFCAEFVPPEYRDKIRHIYKIRGNDITLIEERPPWDGVGTEWTRLPIARFGMNQTAMVGRSRGSAPTDAGCIATGLARVPVSQTCSRQSNAMITRCSLDSFLTPRSCGLDSALRGSGSERREERSPHGK